MRYTQASAIDRITKKRGVRISENKIDLSGTKEQIGNGTWGAIDYLRNHHKFVVVSYPKAVSEE